MPTDPAIQAIQDRIDQEEVKLEKILEEAESLEGRINDLKANRDRFAAILDGTSEPIPIRSTDDGFKLSDVKPRVRITEEEFRDWIVNESDHKRGFSAQEVMDHFGMSQNTASKLIVWAREKRPPLIEATKIRRRNRGDSRKRGAYPTIWRYVDKIPEHRIVPAASNGNGALPVAGTGKKIKVHPYVLDAIRPALKKGAKIAITGGDHLRLTMGDKQPIIMSQTPSDRRVTKQIRSNMREHGYPVS